MRVCLLYNEGAGDGIACHDLTDALGRSGHDVVRIFREPDRLRAELDETVDVVVVAGGDGTVSEAAAALAGRCVPLAIVPLGTANNVARSLGIAGRGTAPLARLDHGRRVSIDLGTVRCQRQYRRFLEAVGFGLLPDGMARTDAAGRTGHAIGRLRDAMRGVQDACAESPARRCVVTLDGVPLEEEVLMLEILNTGHVGPGLELSREACPTDGRLTVVLAGPSHRREIARWLRDRDAGAATPLSLPTRSATRVDVRGWDRCHVDGWTWRTGVSDTVEVRLEPDAVDVLVQPSP